MNLTARITIPLSISALAAVLMGCGSSSSSGSIVFEPIDASISSNATTGAFNQDSGSSTTDGSGNNNGSSNTCPSSCVQNSDCQSGCGNPPAGDIYCCMASTCYMAMAVTTCPAEGDGGTEE